ncbi:RNA polymerase sigma factor RpoH [Parvibium lacunae]|uniref:RNA polymerase sigma factor RpoH n=1 Tax=Parvibium lacunae TaxID=1888893 RepID=A0A368KZY5_9BURK|nr:RNA polymerase sigma factor RpoH [Parvibium lacunae]RCS56865.1 RNA polymerase sigma factor RpoH [Parvibium lacunae]
MSVATAGHALVLAPSHSLAFPQPGSMGSIEAYISAINRFPLLSAEEELDLATRLHDHQDLDAARQLVLSHLRLVVSVARQYLGYGLPHGDLIQEGNVGLMKAVKRFDPTRGVRLVSFALHWIKAEIHEYILKNWRLAKVATTKAQRKLFFNLRSMKQALAQENTLTPQQVAHIAQELNVKPEEVVEMERRMANHDVTLEPSHDDEESYGPSHWLTNDTHQPTEILIAREQDKLHGEGLLAALETLDERSRRIVEARWLQDDAQANATLHDLAAEFGVSAERIRQIEVKAMQKMKQALLAYQ